MRLFLAVAMIAISLAVLESARLGVGITRFDVGQTPVTRYQRPDADGPVVVMAHGFAGSRQMMQGYAFPMARAGYRVFVFDFLGHGRNRRAMSGDVSSVDGTTRLLVEQTEQVLDAVARGQTGIGLLGHSMATDILVRVAAARTDVGPVVLISAFSQLIDARTPDNLLFVSGEWEPGLRRFARERLGMVDPDAAEGQTATDGSVSRRAVVAPYAEHVSVLQSRRGRAEALAWMDRAHGRSSDIAILPTGWAILALLAGIVLAFRPLCRMLPQDHVPGPRLGMRRTIIAVLLPAVLAPLGAVALTPDFLPVLVADYLVVHLCAFGCLQLALLRFWHIGFGRLSWASLALLVAVCALFGTALDRYAANFLPTPERFLIILVMLAGALPCMVADAVLTSRQGLAGRFFGRAGFLASLGIAVALDFEDLFFLILIAPVLILFFLVFATMGRDASLRTGPLGAGIALGVVLAWALGVSFPLFEA
ncbi:alpha/beta fold hydrolase [Sulfitobacter sp. LCG007]